METRRYFLELAYDGTQYHGWQLQPNAVTVQQKLNEALTTLLRQPADTTGAGRTDTGVHARQLYVHFDSQNENLITQRSGFVASLNALLPPDVAVKRIFPVAADAHARFDAVLRSYEYHIHFSKDPFKNNYSWQLRDVPDITLMNQAAQILTEYTDFSCFSKSNTQVMTNNCRLSRAEWLQQPGGGMIFHISADRFLRNMVRAIVGTLLMAGRREMEPEAIRQIMESKSRSKAGASVPARGLCLTEVRYPYISPFMP